MLKVNCALRRLAEGYTENTTLLNKLADQTEDFAVQLIDQISANEELVIRDEPDEADRYASLLSPMTDDAIKFSQKKVRNFLNSKIISCPFYRSYVTILVTLLL